VGGERGELAATCEAAGAVAGVDAIEGTLEDGGTAERRNGGSGASVIPSIARDLVH
jgi:hypothetical protein